jgi:hypothetical protein
MFYDFNQLEADLIQITRKFGKRQQHGFFTIYTYKDEDLTIHDFYSERKVKYKDHDVNLDHIIVESELGMKLLKLAVETDV